MLLDEGHHTAPRLSGKTRVCFRASTVDASELRQLSCVVDYARGGGSSGAFVSEEGGKTVADATRTIAPSVAEIPMR